MNKLTVGETHKEEKTAERGNFRTEIANKASDWRWQWRKYSCSRGIKYLPFSNFDLDKKKCAWYNLLRMRLTASATLVVTQCQNICVLKLMGLTMPLFCAISDHFVLEQWKKSKNQWLLVYLNQFSSMTITILMSQPFLQFLEHLNIRNGTFDIREKKTICSKTDLVTLPSNTHHCQWG